MQTTECAAADLAGVLHAPLTTIRSANPRSHIHLLPLLLPEASARTRAPKATDAAGTKDAMAKQPQGMLDRACSVPALLFTASRSVGSCASGGAGAGNQEGCGHCRRLRRCRPCSGCSCRCRAAMTSGAGGPGVLPAAVAVHGQPQRRQLLLVADHLVAAAAAAPVVAAAAAARRQRH